MKRRKIVHYPCGSTNPYNQLLSASLLAAGVSVEMRRAEHHRNPARSLRWAWGLGLVHFHWIQGLYVGRSRWRFLARSSLFLLVLAGLRVTGTRLVLTVHNLVPHEHGHRRLHGFINAAIGRLVHRLLVHSAPAADAVAREFKAVEKITVIEHIDYGDPVLKEDRMTARKSLSLPLGRKLVLFFGNLRPYKGVNRLLEAAPGLEELACDVVIAGRPFSERYRSELETAAGAQGNIHLRLGELSDEALSRYLIACDAVVLPYTAGLCSGAAHLALAHDRPVVCSPSLAFKHLIEMGIAFAFDPSQPGHLCRAASLAIAQERSSWRMDVARYRLRCHSASVGPRLKQVYSEILGEGAV